MGRRPASPPVVFTLLLCLGFAIPPAAEGQTRSPFDDADLDPALIQHLETGDLADLPSEKFDEDLWAMAAFHALRRMQNIRARELTEQILDRDPESVAGHCLMGMVQHRAEGNLPRALFHLQRSRELIEARWGPTPSDGAPWRWHAMSLLESAMVNGEMGRHEDKVRLLLERDQLYEPPLPADRGWPLMRLRRYDEAKAAVVEALALEGDLDQKAQALTALCAIEAEQQSRQRGYEACKAAVDFDREHEFPGPTPFTNAAEASLGLLRMDEAEQLIQEATGLFVFGTVSNPWLDLMQLYLTQGRTSEALDAVREMLAWRNRQPAFMDEQNRAETEMASAVFLVIAGHAEEAARITQRAMERPDRTGFTSSESEQLEAASAVIDRLARRAAAERAAEEASWSRWRDAPAVRLRELGHRLGAWASGRRAASMLADERILLATLRPYLAGSVELSEWLKPELVELLGAGLVRSALERARTREDLEGAEGYFLVYETEAAWLAGDDARTLELADLGLAALPGAEVQLRARLVVRGAEAALDLGRRGRALELFDQAMQMDPGIVRRLGAALPVKVETEGGPWPRKVGRLLAASPRFQSVDGSAFVLSVEGSEAGGRACLTGPRGARFACGTVDPRAGEDADGLARRLAKELHEEAFAPRLDLTQSDISSLDGSPTAAGGRSNDRIRSILTDLTGNNAQEP
ncbi:MAG: tetratricopeptide repeat protein [Acidobacteriota bacterium]